MLTWSLDLGSTKEGFKERYRFYTTTITYIHARIQEFFVGFGGGRGGVQARLTKISSDFVFSLLFSVSSQLILQRESSDHGFFQRKLSLNYNFPIFHGEGRSNISRGFNFSQVERVQLHISI